MAARHRRQSDWCLALQPCCRPGHDREALGPHREHRPIAGRTTPKLAGPHYAAAKAGIAALTRALAIDLAPHGITVNCVAPAWITSNMTAPADSDAGRNAAAGIPLGRVGDPADVAGGGGVPREQ